MADPLAPLQRRPADELRRLEEATRGREEAEQRATHELRRREKATRGREEAEQRLAELEREQERMKQCLDEDQRRPTTLFEYIKACHELMYSKSEVETDKSLMSKGTVTNPQKKFCPTRLSPWSEFLAERTRTLTKLNLNYSRATPEIRQFKSRDFLKGLGEMVSRRKIANEKHLEFVQHLSVELPVTDIINYLEADDKVNKAFKIGGGIVFENHPNAISDNVEEVLGRQMAQAQRGLNHDQVCPDQICVYKNSPNSEDRSIAYIIEYKVPHKLTPPHLRLGLRPMNIYEEVVNRATRPTEEDLQFQYDADRLAAASITQTFHYMIECGLEYSILTTGEAYVFLKIDWTDPTILYYHLAEPGSEASGNLDTVEHCAAVGQVLALSLMALGGRTHGQEVRDSAKERLERWMVDYDAMLKEIPLSERKAPPDSVGYQSTTYKRVDRSPYLLRSKKMRFQMASPDINIPHRQQTSDSSDEDKGNQQPDSSPCTDPTTPCTGPTTPCKGPTTPCTCPKTPCKQRAQRRQSEKLSNNRQRGQSRDAAEDSLPQYQYCTQECLLGLVRGACLDKQCPNVALHQQRKGGELHPVSHAQWLQLLKKQLKQTLDEGIVRLGKEGARGVLFQVTLLRYGYTFVGKGTVPAFVEDLKHEAKVYDRLQPLQGTGVPVSLGAIDLRDISKTYYYDLGVRVIYMKFLSWGGQRLNDVKGLDAEKTIRDVLRLLKMLHSRGVVHMDVRKPNVLWNQETSRVMLIDFERADLTEDPRPPLAKLVSNKRQRTQAAIECGEAKGQLYSVAAGRAWEDIDAANVLFQ